MIGEEIELTNFTHRYQNNVWSKIFNEDQYDSLDSNYNSNEEAFHASVMR